MKIFNLENMIIDILGRNRVARKDDHMLYIEVCSDINPNCLDNFMEAFKYRKEFGLPSFESVSRARRKVQEKYPEFLEEKKIRNNNSPILVSFGNISHC